MPVNKDRDIISLTETAVQVLRSGGTVLYPSDTVWGFGCDACNAGAVEKVSAIKGRTGLKNYIILVADLNMLSRYVEQIPDMAGTLLEVADKPLTIIYPGGINLAPGVTAPDGSVAIRIPQHDFCRAMIRKLKRPLLSTSANLSGSKTPARYIEIDKNIIIKADWTAPAFLEAGATGKPSSIIRLGINNQIEIIRP
ncbi:MAG: L-threonylcarbamoyladenylate synthase [Bacteroidales bacterium]|jgi:L-threonylcarbamoyladenylate synthase|nr:L-threonylcarbamoyladenylate synthase [Bacteroidales bacterium]